MTEALGSISNTTEGLFGDENAVEMEPGVVPHRCSQVHFQEGQQEAHPSISRRCHIQRRARVQYPQPYSWHDIQPAAISLGPGHKSKAHFHVPTFALKRPPKPQTTFKFKNSMGSCSISVSLATLSPSSFISTPDERG